MKPSAFLSAIQQCLHPDPYTYMDAPPPQGVDLLLTCNRFWLARYALAVVPWDDSLDGREFLKSRRSLISRAMGALWTLREVGLYLVIAGPEQQWRKHAGQMPADKTGLHAVIVQAVHFVDLEKGATAINQSAWGPVKFGGVDSVAHVVNSVLHSTSS